MLASRDRSPRHPGMIFRVRQVHHNLNARIVQHVLDRAVDPVVPCPLECRQPVRVAIIHPANPQLRRMQRMTIAIGIRDIPAPDKCYPRALCHRWLSSAVQRLRRDAMCTSLNLDYYKPPQTVPPVSPKRPITLGSFPIGIKMSKPIRRIPGTHPAIRFT